MTDDSKPDESAPAPDVARIELPPEHPAIEPFSFLLGRWGGTARGDYPPMEPFDFFQEVTFSHIGKPYLIYTSRSWRLATDENGEPKRDVSGEAISAQPLAVGRGGPRARRGRPRAERPASESASSRSRLRRASGVRSPKARWRCCSATPPE